MAALRYEIPLLMLKSLSAAEASFIFMYGLGNGERFKVCTQTLGIFFCLPPPPPPPSTGGASAQPCIILYLCLLLIKCRQLFMFTIYSSRFKGKKDLVP